MHSFAIPSSFFSIKYTNGATSIVCLPPEFQAGSVSSINLVNGSDVYRLLIRREPNMQPTSAPTDQSMPPQAPSATPSAAPSATPSAAPSATPSTTPSATQPPLISGGFQPRHKPYLPPYYKAPLDGETLDFTNYFMNPSSLNDFCAGREVVTFIFTPFSKLDHLTSCARMFLNCSKLKEVRFPVCATLAKLTDCAGMFGGCPELTTLVCSSSNLQTLVKFGCGLSIAEGLSLPTDAKIHRFGISGTAVVEVGEV